jgi:hypothetical protein
MSTISRCSAGSPGKTLTLGARTAPDGQAVCRRGLSLVAGQSVSQPTLTGNNPWLMASASAAVCPIGHEIRDAVEHVLQACLELLLPAVQGEPGRQAVHRWETPGIDLAGRVE